MVSSAQLKHTNEPYQISSFFSSFENAYTFIIYHMKCWLFTILFVCTISSYAQHYRMHPSIPTDSSYTMESTLSKLKPKFPFISPAVLTSSDSFYIKKNITYQYFGNRKMHLDLFLPHFKTATKPFPVVVLVHGGGWRSGNKDMEHCMAQVYALNGFAAVCVEYRLSMEALYPAALQDIKTAIRWVRYSATRYHLDPSRIALHGESAGGQLVSLIGSMNAPFPKYQTPLYARFSDKVQAVVDVDGVQAFLHPVSSENGDKSGKPGAGTLWFGVSSVVDSTLWIQASALTHVGAQSASFLYLRSSYPRFTAGYVEMMANLRSNGIYCEEHELAGTPHSFWLFHPWVDTTMQYAVGFLKRVFM
jgi:acetyl esterase/lipase